MHHEERVSSLCDEIQKKKKKKPKQIEEFWININDNTLNTIDSLGGIIEGQVPDNLSWRMCLV